VADAELKVLRVSNEGYQGREGVEAFREIFGRTILGIEIDPQRDHPLHFDMTIRALPDIAVASGALSPMRNHHPAELANDDDVVLVMMKEGAGQLDQHRQTAIVRAGEAVLTTNAESGTFAGLSATRLVNLRLRRDLLAAQMIDVDAAIARTIAADNLGLTLLAGYAGTLADTTAIASAEARRTVSLHLYDLAALALGSSHDARVHAKGVRAARLRAIKADIRDHVQRHDLTMTGFARRHGISASYVRRLFADEGTSYSDFVLEQRLIRAVRTLRDPRSADRTISAIAYESGFGDLSYFNRTFRRRYGMTPSDMRAAAERER
jgi:AraC-like DNA-binding protein